MAKIWVRRGFLNDPADSAGGWFKFLIEPLPTKETKGKYIFPDVEFTISDCSRRMSLDFHPWTSNRTNRGKIKSINDKRKKLNLLVKSVNEFAERLNAEFDAYEADLNEQ